MVVIKNNLVNHSFSIIFQVTIIFIFLTLFFFYYVTKIEQEEFETQIEIVINELYKEIKNDIPIPPQTTKEELFILVDGLLDLIEKKSSKNSETYNKIININNNTKKKAFKTLTYTLLFVIILSFILYSMKFYLNFPSYIKTSLIVVFFVAIVEFTFLQLIAKKYISVSPNNVKLSFAKSIQNWLKQNNKI